MLNKLKLGISGVFPISAGARVGFSIWGSSILYKLFVIQTDYPVCLNLHFCTALLSTEMTRFQNIVKGARHNATKGEKKSVFHERTDEASAAQYFQVRRTLK